MPNESTIVKLTYQVFPKNQNRRRMIKKKRKLELKVLLSGELNKGHGIKT